MTNKELWAKEFKRITRIAKGLTKGTNIEFVFPKQPKRIEKKSIERLRKITPATIREIIAEQKEQSQKQKVQIEIAKAARVKEPEEPKKGYRYQAITPEERSRRAKKAAATRAAKGIKPFGEATHEELSARAKKGAETRAAKGIKPFGEATHEELSARAKKGAETRAAKGIKPFGGEASAEARSARAKKAAATRRENRLKRLNGDKVETIDEETGEITEEPVDTAVPEIDKYQLIIDNYLQQLEEYKSIHPQGFYIDKIIEELNTSIDNYGNKNVAIALIKMALNNIEVTMPVAYNTDDLGKKYLERMITFLSGAGLIDVENGMNMEDIVGQIDDVFSGYDGGVEDELEYLNKTYVWTDGL